MDKKIDAGESFEKSSIIVFILTMTANVCNYLFQIIVGKMLSVEDYAQVNTVLAIVSVLAIPTTIITMICARYIALNYSEGKENNIISVLKVLIRMIVTIDIVMLVGAFILMKGISSLFGLYSKWYVIGAVIVAIFNLFFAITSGTLQGMKKFVPYGIQTICTSLGKLIFSVIFIIIGWNIGGVICGVLMGILLAITLGLKYMWTYIKKSLVDRSSSYIDIKEFFRYAIGTFIAQGCVIALTNGDILLVKVYFSDTEAGLYSSAMVIGKIAMYVATAVIATLFPMVVEKYNNGEDTVPLFRKAMLYGGGISLICAAGMILLGKYVIGILFGQKYLEAIQYLPSVCMFVVPLTFITILMNYLLAINKAKVFDILIGIGVIAILVGSYFAHDTIQNLMNLVGAVLVIVFAGTVISMIMRKKKNVEI